MSGERHWPLTAGVFHGQGGGDNGADGTQGIAFEAIIDVDEQGPAIAGSDGISDHFRRCGPEIRVGFLDSIIGRKSIHRLSVGTARAQEQSCATTPGCR